MSASWTTAQKLGFVDGFELDPEYCRKQCPAQSSEVRGSVDEVKEAQSRCVDEFVWFTLYGANFDFSLFSKFFLLFADGALYAPAPSGSAAWALPASTCRTADVTAQTGFGLLFPSSPVCKDLPLRHRAETTGGRWSVVT